MSPLRAISTGVGAELHATLDQAGQERRVQRDEAGRRCRLEPRAVAALERDGVGIDDDGLDAIGLHVAQKIGERRLEWTRQLVAAGTGDHGDGQHGRDRTGHHPDQTNAWQLSSKHNDSPDGVIRADLDLDQTHTAACGMARLWRNAADARWRSSSVRVQILSDDANAVNREHATDLGRKGSAVRVRVR